MPEPSSHSLHHTLPNRMDQILVSLTTAILIYNLLYPTLFFPIRCNNRARHHKWMWWEQFWVVVHKMMQERRMKSGETLVHLGGVGCRTICGECSSDHIRAGKVGNKFGRASRRTCMYSRHRCLVESKTLSSTSNSTSLPQCQFANSAWSTLAARRLSWASLTSRRDCWSTLWQLQLLGH